MKHSFQQLEPQDVQTFKELIHLFGDAFEDDATYKSAVPDDAYLKRLLQKEDFIALTAQSDGKVIGGLVAYVLEKFEQDRREIYIYDLAVAEEYRRQKVATSLINHLKSIAKKKKAYVIFVQADYVDPPAIKLYESLGTKEEVLHFDIDPE